MTHPVFSKRLCEQRATPHRVRRCPGKIDDEGIHCLLLLGEVVRAACSRMSWMKWAVERKGGNERSRGRRGLSGWLRSITLTPVGVDRTRKGLFRFQGWVFCRRSSSRRCFGVRWSRKGAGDGFVTRMGSGCGERLAWPRGHRDREA